MLSKVVYLSKTGFTFTILLLHLTSFEWWCLVARQVFKICVIACGEPFCRHNISIKGNLRHSQVSSAQTTRITNLILNDAQCVKATDGKGMRHRKQESYIHRSLDSKTQIAMSTCGHKIKIIAQLGFPLGPIKVVFPFSTFQFKKCNTHTDAAPKTF